MKLKSEIKNSIRRNKQVVRALEDYFDISNYTLMYVWIPRNNPKLTQIGALKIIAAYLKIEIDNLYEKEEIDFANIT